MSGVPCWARSRATGPLREPPDWRDRLWASARHSADANGPYFLSLILEQEPDLAIFGPQLFYPYLWDELERRNEAFPDAYAVHHWASARSRAKPVICGW